MEQVKKLIAERAKTHGEFWKTAECAQYLVGATHYQPDGPSSGWGALSLVQREALDNIQRKIARILTGDPDHRDAWIDIQGYCQLVLDRLPKNVSDETLFDEDTLDRLNAYLDKGSRRA